ncbi:MAG: hypothetical protein GEU93_12390 [Propionibacteriales bacterium]|nr:hypothetical protein [Propionibacteriales bacterium]
MAGRRGDPPGPGRHVVGAADQSHARRQPGPPSPRPGAGGSLMQQRLASLAMLSLFAWLASMGAAFALLPLFEYHAYLIAAIVFTLPALVVGIALRMARVPVLLVPLGQVAALILWIAWIYTVGTGWFEFVPSDGGLSNVRFLIEIGLDEANEYAAPAPDTPGLTLITALGVTGCHLVVDLIAVGMRSAPLTGMPLLALYTAPAALAPEGVPVLAFIPGATGFIALLAYDERERLVTWGRQVSTIAAVRSVDQQRRLNVSALNISAQRVGLAAIAVAAVVPFFVPVFPENLFERGPKGAGGNGQVRVSNPIVDLRRDLTERSEETAMLIRTTDGRPQYFRLAALDEFDGKAWKFSDRDVSTQNDLVGALPIPPGLDLQVASTEKTYGVRISDNFQTDWLPSPYAPQSVQAPGEWRYDPDTFDIVKADEDQSAAGIGYRLRVVEADPTFDHLMGAGGNPTDISAGYTAVPNSVPDEVSEIAQNITSSATSRFERAVQLQQWFRQDGGFRYTLAPPPGHSGDDIMAFLDGKEGYCEQFAAAMAVMARLLDIPSRVAVGFLSAELGDRPNEWRYAFSDLHAWPELYFEGTGWVRFEPTPAGGTDAIPTVAPSYTTGTTGEDGQIPQNLPNQNAAPPETSPDALSQDRLDPQLGSGGGSDGDGSSRWWLPVLVVAAGIALLPAIVRMLVRRTRWTRAQGDVALAEAVWAEVRDTIRDLRHEWPWDTPRRTARAVSPLIAHDEAALGALWRIAIGVERSRYARVPQDGARLRPDLETVVGALRHHESRADRIRAVLLPRSLRPRYWQEHRLSKLRTPTHDGDASVLPSAP